MSDRIIQLIPAPEGLLMAFDLGDKTAPVEFEPPVALAVVERGVTQTIVPVETSDGELMLATDNPHYIGVYWENDNKRHILKG